MSEWPSADWLTDAIDRWTDTVETSEDAWESIQERIMLSPEGSDDPSANDSTGDTIRRDRQGFRRLLSIAAVLVVLVGAVLLGRQSSPSIETGPADEVTVPSTSTSAAEPLPPRLADFECTRLSADPTSYLLELASGGTSVVVISSAALNADSQTTSMFHLARASAADQAGRTRLSEELRREDSVAYIDMSQLDNEEGLGDVFAALAPSFCHSPAFYLILDEGLDTNVFCEPHAAPGTGFAGLIALDPSQPPPSCSGVHPTILIGAASVEDPLVQAWATAQGCENPDSPSAEDSSFQWGGCTATFLYAQTDTLNPWDSTVDGVSLQDFVQSIKTLAN